MHTHGTLLWAKDTQDVQIGLSHGGKSEIGTFYFFMELCEKKNT